MADERVEADVNRICITRGPLVYCAEGPDNEYPASNYIIQHTEQKGQITAFDDGILKGIPSIFHCPPNVADNGILKGIPSIQLEAEVLKNEQTTPATITLIPYYAWNNRGDNVTMNVWFARNAETVGK